MTGPRLILLCGLPASGKTTLARQLAETYHAVRLNPDEWMTDLRVDLHDEEFRARLEAEFWLLAQRLLASGMSVVLEWGFWVRSERDEKREVARSLGASVELRFLDAPLDELVQRAEERHREGGIAITRRHMEHYVRFFQPPTDEEMALFDPPGARTRTRPRSAPAEGRDTRENTPASAPPAGRGPDQR